MYRSLLFSPGDDAYKMNKALLAGADGVILDLEDAVAPAAKPAARSAVAQFLHHLPPDGPPVFLRINDVAGGTFREDLDACCDREVAPHLAGLLVPKVEDPVQVREVAEATWRLCGRSIPLIPMIESARGLRLAYEIATADPAVQMLALGGVDLSQDLGVSLTPSGDELLYTWGKMVADSRAAGIDPPLDTVWPFLDDDAGLEATARRARSLGLQGKLVVHPRQVPIVNRVFNPTESEIRWARQVVAAFEEMTQAGQGVARVGGQMVERPIYLRALRILELARTQKAQ